MAGTQTPGSRERGAVFVETAIGFPIFIALVFLILYIGYIYHARTCIKSSVKKGLKAGITRGEMDRMNATLSGSEGVVQGIEAYINSGGSGWDSIDELFRSTDVDPGDAETQYDTWVAEVYGDDAAPTFANLPPEALYGLFYALESMRISLGRLVRFPCDLSTDNEGGCLECKFLEWGATGFGVAGPGGNDLIPTDRIGIRCRYRPWAGFTKPIRGLIGDNALLMKASGWRLMVEQEF